MSRLYWTVAEAMNLLAEAYWVDLGNQSCAPDPVTLEALARALDARPEMLEYVWETWEDELILAGWSVARRDAARHWLDAAVIGGIVMR